MGKSWMPITAAILVFVCSGFGVISGIIISFMIMSSEAWLYYTTTHLVTMDILLLVIGALAIVGGIYTLIMKKWPLALVGAIAAFISTTPTTVAFFLSFQPQYFFSALAPLGLAMIPAVVAIILIVLSRKQFERK